jgi:hypothetical protein
MSKPRPPRHLSRLVCAVVGLAALGLSFGYGVGVGFYHWPPFPLLKNAKALYENRIGRAGGDYRGEKELLQLAFTDPLIKGEQIRPRITSLDGIHEANRSLLLPVERFFEAYDHLEVKDATHLVLDQGATHVLKVTYDLAGTRYDAYAYAVHASKPSYSAALIIPGSGFNQSSAIYNNDPSNYHFGIMEALGASVAKFVLIKPNEDCLAFHDGKAKINQDFSTNWLLARGASYSAHYITNSLAITKYLQTQYGKVVVAGLSQGGYAALLNSLQSQPHVAIIASGFSVVDAQVMWSGGNQIIIPGLDQRLSVADMRSRMRPLHTSFLFTYGKDEDGTYKIEANERLTCQYLSTLQNVECRIHKQGHVFPVATIREFLSRKS